MSSVHQILFLSELKASIFTVHLTCTLKTNTVLSYNTQVILPERYNICKSEELLKISLNLQEQLSKGAEFTLYFSNSCQTVFLRVATSHLNNKRSTPTNSKYFTTPLQCGKISILNGKLCSIYSFIQMDLYLLCWLLPGWVSLCILAYFVITLITREYPPPKNDQSNNIVLTNFVSSYPALIILSCILNLGYQMTQLFMSLPVAQQSEHLITVQKIIGLNSAGGSDFFPPPYTNKGVATDTQKIVGLGNF